jgi:hypothetical protein
MLQEGPKIGFVHNRGQTGSSGIHCANGIGVVRKKNDGSGDVSAPQLASGLKPIHAGHLEVENNQIGAKMQGFLEGVQAVNRFAADLVGCLALEKVTRGRPYHGIVVDNEDGFLHCHLELRWQPKHWRAP